MRHVKRQRKLGRTGSHRTATLQSLACALIRHEAITTTVPKAKEARRFVERLITTARKGTLQARRRVASRLQDEDAARKLVEDIAPRFADRPGGYTRVLKLGRHRVGDGTQLCRLELTEMRETEEAEE
ncbi:MAG: 50S ribosomal protein L17 [Phycisphaerae bacterium]